VVRRRGYQRSSNSNSTNQAPSTAINYRMTVGSRVRIQDILGSRLVHVKSATAGATAATKPSPKSTAVEAAASTWAEAAAGVELDEDGTDGGGHGAGGSTTEEVQFPFLQWLLELADAQSPAQVRLEDSLHTLASTAVHSLHTLSSLTTHSLFTHYTLSLHSLHTLSSLTTPPLFTHPNTGTVSGVLRGRECAAYVLHRQSELGTTKGGSARD
jgi:hypothetical protein